MEEDLDETVERCASLLLSTDLGELGEVVLSLNSLRTAETLAAAEHNSRVVQEIAAFRGGLVPALLLLFLVQDCETEQQEQIGDYHTLALGILSASKVVVERCLRTDGTRAEPETARKIFVALTHRSVGRARNLPKGASSDVRAMSGVQIAHSLGSLVNLARGSKVFRDSMKESLDQGSLFEHFGDLLKADFLDSLPTASDSVLRIRHQLSSLVVCLAFSADSQSWALDMGLLKLVAAIYEASPLQELSSMTRSQGRIAPAFRCNKVLFRLLMLEPTTERLRAHNALSGFRPHRRKINAAEPERVDPNVWKFFEGRLHGVGSKPGEMRKLTAEEWKSVEEACYGGDPAYVVCSWKRCAAGREAGVGKGFSACGRCHVARYCSKEHQKLHWATHKVHCKEHPAKEGAV